jgi:N6-L-threonylcarbamoyladenine synthase/protein kinase Bud32
VSENIIYQGAEAEIVLSNYLGKKVIQKRRLSKSYRIKEIDSHLISSRTKKEARLISEARKSGVSVPIIYDVNLEKGVITLQYLNGKRIKDIINDLDERSKKMICIKIGESIAKLHNCDIIHGDITTSNMILLDDRVHFIDFGLGDKSDEIEARGVDLHVLMEAFESTHSKYPQCFEYVLEGYKNNYCLNANAVINKVNDIVKRGRYR